MRREEFSLLCRGTPRLPMKWGNSRNGRIRRIRNNSNDLLISGDAEKCISVTRWELKLCNCFLQKDKIVGHPVRNWLLLLCFLAQQKRNPSLCGRSLTVRGWRSKSRTWVVLLVCIQSYKLQCFAYCRIRHANAFKLHVERLPRLQSHPASQGYLDSR